MTATVLKSSKLDPSESLKQIAELVNEAAEANNDGVGLLVIQYQRKQEHDGKKGNMLTIIGHHVSNHDVATAIDHIVTSNPKIIHLLEQIAEVRAAKMVHSLMSGGEQESK